MRSRFLPALFLFIALCIGSPAFAQLGTAFTYQGSLEVSGQPYTGAADFVFEMWTAPTGGTSLNATATSGIQVRQGVFTAQVDYGTSYFSGAPRYLAISVRAPSGIGSYVPLAGRQAITPAPYAFAIPNVTPVGANVGIGTTTPASKLEVIGETRTSTLEVVGGVIAQGGAVAATSDLGLYSLTSGSWMRLVSNNGPIQFFTNSVQGASGSPVANSMAMTIAANGNIGVGTGSPQTKLNVVGTIRYASDATASPANTFDISSGGAIDLVASNDIYMNSRGGRKDILLNSDAASGNIGIGTSNPTEKLHVNGNIRAKVVIIEGGADLAESYDVAPAADIKPIPGMVVTIDAERVGKLRVATTVYDHTVAGIISGADNVAPGLVLGQKGTLADGAFPIANVGRVWCYVDADANGPVVPGDLLTTSATPGHAMKASDRALSSGATLGKAMSRLEKGKGLVLVLVTLQ